MVKQDVVVKLETGLQARPAAEFVRKANEFTAYLYIEKQDRKVNAKSIMGIMSLAVGAEEAITLVAEGVDEDEALSQLTSFVQ